MSLGVCLLANMKASHTWASQLTGHACTGGWSLANEHVRQRQRNYSMSYWGCTSQEDLQRPPEQCPAHHVSRGPQQIGQCFDDCRRVCAHSTAIAVSVWVLTDAGTKWRQTTLLHLFVPASHGVLFNDASSLRLRVYICWGDLCLLFNIQVDDQ